METIVAAAISACATLGVCIVTNHMQEAKTRALLEYQISELARKVERHNHIVERMYKLEGRVTEAEHDLRDLRTQNGRERE